MKVAISGVSGLIGQALRRSLAEDGHEVIALSRQRSLPPLETITWDVAAGRFDASRLEGCDAVVHLAGEPIAQRWNAARKKEIRDSRIKSTKLLVEGLKSLVNRPKVFVSGSAVGFYGDRGEEELTETSEPGRGFLPELSQEWERAALDALGLGIRSIVVRTGIVLSTQGGALKKMLLPFWLGVGGRVGDGKQYMPWIHIDDMVGTLRFVLGNEDLMGVVNATAPNPSTNAEFSKALGRALRRPAVFPVPTLALRLGFGEMSQVILEGQRVLPQKLVEAGYRFQFPELDDALQDVVRHRK